MAIDFNFGSGGFKLDPKIFQNMKPPKVDPNVFKNIVPPAPSPPIPGPNSNPTITQSSDSAPLGTQYGGGTNRYGIDRPSMYSPLDISTGEMSSAYTMGSPDKIGFSPARMGQAGKALTDRATMEGPSPWLNLQLDQNQMDQMRQLDAMNMEQAGSQADARGQLAMRGGLSTGARERLAGSGAREAMRASQDIYGQRAGADLQSRMFDEQTKTGLLGTAAGLESDLSKFNTSGQLEKDKFNTTLGMQADQFNIGNKLNQVGMMNAAKSGIYGEDMKAWAAQQMANSMGGGGGFAGGVGGLVGSPLAGLGNWGGGGLNVFPNMGTGGLGNIGKSIMPSGSGPKLPWE